MKDINTVDLKKCSLGIELGSTRIKAVLIDEKNNSIAQGSYTWNNEIIDDYYSYPLDKIWSGVRSSYSRLKEDFESKYSIKITIVKSIGISAMMHGYFAFDDEDELLVPFRTWRNTTTEEASGILSEKFKFPIPQRWSVSHHYQAILNKEDHVNKIAKLHTLASYVHYMLSSNFVIGVGDASGMFPVDSNTKNYNSEFVKIYDDLISVDYSILDVLPEVLSAGKNAGYLSGKGALILDEDGDLQEGIVMCPPEGDAGTGMVATNSVRVNSGNVSAGTSVFAMIVLEKELSAFYKELDLVTTPDGKPVAMVHANNCTGEYDSWINLFKQVIEATGLSIDVPTLYDKILNQALIGDEDCGGLMAYNYLSGEPMTGFDDGRPLFVRALDSSFNLPNFMRAQLFSSLCALRIGLDILFEKEGIELNSITGHGGFFKTPVVGQTVMAAATHTPIDVLESAGEGGAWGIAVLAKFVGNKKSLQQFLDEDVFCDVKKVRIEASQKDCDGFDRFLDRYMKAFAVEKSAVDCI